MYMWAFSIFIDILILIALLLLSMASISRGGYKRLDNVIFAGFSILVAIWIISNTISNETSIVPGVSIIANYIVFGSSFLAMFTLSYFVARL